MRTDSQHIDRIIVRFLAGEATDVESNILNRWMEESEANKKYFGDIQFISSKAVASHRVVKVDVDKAWEKVQHQLKSKTSASVDEARVIPFSIPDWLKIAAVVAVVSAVSFGMFRYLYLPRIESQQMMSIASADSVINRKLDDGSSVVINRNSKITYSRDYGKTKRELKLEGEAFFDVQHVDDKPFVVEAEGTYVEDIGTSFNIKAFEGDTIVEVFVITGEVMFFSDENKGVSLKEGETGVYSKKSRTFRKIVSQKENPISYVNRIFVFQNTRLSEVVQQLSSVYNVGIILQNDNLKDCSITVTFENEDIDVVLSIIAETLNLQLGVVENKFILDGESCSNEEQQ